jgi:signal transduction histidine kinase
MAVLGELSAKVAHEVNNPLGIIKNYIQLLSRQSGNDTKSADYISVLSQEINRIANIVRQLLDMSRTIHVEFEKTDLDALLGEIVTLVKRQLDDVNISIEFIRKGKLPTITAWSDGLKQVFMNLILNAKDAIESEGSIKIEATPMKNKIRILVKDSGPGINPINAKQIFEPFYSTKSIGTGTGLGLSVCNSIIKKHNGLIEVCLEKKGGCFKIELPIEQEETEYDYAV